MDYTISPPEEMIETAITLPISKSMYNRAVLMQALTPGAPQVSAPSPCDDASAMKEALYGSTDEKNIGAAGTAMRFLTAYYAAKEGCEVTIDGIERMRHRPIAILVDALRKCGAQIEYLGEEGFPPLRIKGRQLHGCSIDVDSTVSSQFVSALMMVAPTFTSPLEINLIGEVSSLPYIKMTLGMMHNRGIEAELYNDTITITPGEYHPIGIEDVEPDWSAASYWYAIAAMSAGWITLPALRLPSLQGDSRIAQIYEKLGVLTNESEDTPGALELSASPEVFSRIEDDFSDIPDVVMTVAVTCCMLGVPFHFSGVKSLRIKECDRIQALKNELAKLSYDIEIKNDNEIKWDGRRVPVFETPVIDTYGDHRIAMSMATTAVYVSGLVIKDVEVVSKSYPGFWDDMRTAGFDVQCI